MPVSDEFREYWHVRRHARLQIREYTAVIRLGFLFSVVIYETIGYIHKDKSVILLSGGLGKLTDPEWKSVPVCHETGRESSLPRFKESVSSKSTSLRCIVIIYFHWCRVQALLRQLNGEESFFSILSRLKKKIRSHLLHPQVNCLVFTSCCLWTLSCGRWIHSCPVCSVYYLFYYLPICI
jgi:hypothetical protein